MTQKCILLISLGLPVSLLMGCFDLVDKVEPATAIQPPSSAPPSTTNAAPLISGNPDTNATVGMTWSFTPSGSDPDGDAVTFSIRNQPTWTSFDTSNGRLSGVPQPGQQGVYASIRISVDDGEMTTSLPEFTVTVLSTITNNAPLISGTPPGAVTAGQQFLFLPGSSDPDGDALTFDIANRPAWATFDSSTGELRGTPVVADVGLFDNIVISVGDGQQTASLPVFAISVQSPAVPNNAPQISGDAATSAIVSQMYAFQPDASDSDGDKLTFSIVNIPSWASFSPITGLLTGTPVSGDEGTYQGVVISVSDGQSTVSLPAFAINVRGPINSNSAPQISGNANANASVGQLYAFQPVASDADGDNLTFAIANRPGWASFSTATGLLTGTPADSDEGSYPNIVISVSDGQATAVLPAFSIVVDNPNANETPQISGTATTAISVGHLYAFQPGASDADGDSLTFAIANRPGWTSFSSTTGLLTGTPADGNEGNYPSIVISVSDGTVSVSLPAFSIAVDNPNANETPQISGNPPTTVTAGEPYAFQPNATDADGDALTFSISNQPSWTTFDTASGRLAGTAADGDEGIHGNIIISVSDGAESSSLPAFDITVSAANTNEAPVISGDPVTSATVDQPYSFQPTASDADGDNLSFSISNQPSWSSFDAATGRLNGTPAQGDAAVYDNIQITVNDGELSASLPAFSITVSQAATGSATLTWTAPTRNTDGSPLIDLIAYKIHYGTAPGDYPDNVRIDNPGITRYVIDNLTANAYFFVVTSINSSEIESALSNEAPLTIN